MPVLQYIGSTPTWGPQQQTARLRNRLNTTDLGLADADPTVKAPTGGNPDQLRWRDSTQAAIGANQQWARKRLSSNELGAADGDPTVRPPWADGAAYLWPVGRQPAAITGTVAWARLRLNTTDLGQVDADATVRPPWADGSAYLWPAPRQTAQITATNAWGRSRLTSNDLGSIDADPTVRAPYQDPHQRRHLDAAYAVLPTLAWMRLRLTTNDLGTADQDTSIRPLWQTANPYTLRLGPSPLPAIEATLAQLRAWEASTPVEDSTDPTVRPPLQDPYQRRRTDPAAWSVGVFTQWMRARLPGRDDETISPGLRVQPRTADPSRIYFRRRPTAPVVTAPIVPDPNPQRIYLTDHTSFAFADLARTEFHFMDRATFTFEE